MSALMLVLAGPGSHHDALSGPARITTVDPSISFNQIIISPPFPTPEEHRGTHIQTTSKRTRPSLYAAVSRDVEQSTPIQILLITLLYSTYPVT